jgi:glycosyltransferase involved in cell wall biosynthesis
MKVLSLVLRLDGGGAERSVAVLSEALGDRNVDVVTYALDPALAGERSNQDQTLTTRRLRGIWRIMVLARRLGQVVKSEGPDILHAHCETPELVTALAVLFMNDPPFVVVTEHSMQSWAGMRPLGWVTRWVLRRRRTKFVSCFDRAGSLDKVIANPVSPAGKPLRSPEGGHPRLIVVSRLAKNKRVDWVIRAAAESGWRDELLVIGDGPERRILENLAQECGLAAEFCGYHKAPWAKVRDRDIFVSASAYEGEPLALLEAIAHRLPLLVSRIAAHERLLGDHPGYFDTVEDLARRLAAIDSGSEAEVADLVPTSHMLNALKSRSPAAVAQAWVSVYDQVVGV